MLPLKKMDLTLLFSLSLSGSAKRCDNTIMQKYRREAGKRHQTHARCVLYSDYYSDFASDFGLALSAVKHVYVTFMYSISPLAFKTPRSIVIKNKRFGWLLSIIVQ